MAVLDDQQRLTRGVALPGWRVIGGLSYAGSGGCFVVGLRLLYGAEGPRSLPVQLQLAHGAGQALFAHVTSILAVAAVLAAVASVSLHARLWAGSPYVSCLAVLLTAMAAAILVAVLSMQFGLVSVGHEGIAPNETAFHALVVFEHGAADVGGWTSWALLAAATLLTCTTLLTHRTWNAAAIAGVLAVATLPVLYVLGSSYLFMLPFGLWELLIAGQLMFRANALSSSPPIRSPDV